MNVLLFTTFPVGISYFDNEALLQVREHYHRLGSLKAETEMVFEVRSFGFFCFVFDFLRIVCQRKGRKQV